MPLSSGGPPKYSSMAEPRPLRRELGAAAEDAGDAGVFERLALLLERLAQGLEQLRRGEHALDVVPGREDRQRLVDAVLLVRFEVLHPALLDQLHDPPRIEVDAEADAAADTGPDARPPAAAAAARSARASASSPPWENTCRAASPKNSRSRSSGPQSPRGSWECPSCRRFRRRTSACRHTPSASSGCAGPPRSHSSSNSGNF